MKLIALMILTLLSLTASGMSLSANSLEGSDQTQSVKADSTRPETPCNDPEFRREILSLYARSTYQDSIIKELSWGLSLANEQVEELKESVQALRFSVSAYKGAAVKQSESILALKQNRNYLLGKLELEYKRKKALRIGLFAGIPAALITGLLLGVMLN